VVRFVVISEALARFWVEKGVPKEKILVLHDGFNAELFEKQRSREEAREKLRLPMGRRIVVYAGRLGPDRGVEVIIDLARACPDAHFLVLGGPDEQRSLLEQKSRAMGIRNVIWKGYVPHSVVAEYLFAADVLLMLWSWDVPHIRCFSPLKMFEYMAAGRIIVGQDYPTIGEVLRDGTTAYLANPDSLEDLCDKVRQALQEEYPSAMADRVRQMALQDYSWNSRAQKILASLKGLI
jgi:glycosyltransferase involved in cell wall biosynthesis